MTRSKSLAFAVAFTLGTAASGWAQSVISAHSGTIHYTEGQVSLDGNAIQPKFGEFPEVKSGQVLSTQDGRAEILLTPGVFLRLGENSSFKMVSNQLSNTRLEVQSGEAMIEVGELLPDNAIAVVFHQGDISIAKRGLYRFDSDPAKLRVYEGEASVVSPSTDPTMVRKGHELIFGDAKLEARTFDAKETDEFYRWSARRDEYVAEANITSAKAVRDTNGGMGYAGGSCMGSGMGISSNVGTYYGAGGGTFSNVAMNNGLGLTPGSGVGSVASVNTGVGMGGTGSWAFNPWFGMFTYVPCSGTYFSPFGYGYFSPYAVGYLYGPYSPYAYGNGYGYAGGRTGIANLGGIGRTGGLASSAAAPATSSSIGRAAGSTGGFGNGGSNTSRGGGGFSGGSGGGFGGGSGGGGGISGGAHGGGASSGGGKH